MIASLCGFTFAGRPETGSCRLLPIRSRVESDRVETLNLDASGAAGAFDPKQFAWDLRQSHLLDGQPRLPGGAWIPQDIIPVFLG